MCVLGSVRSCQSAACDYDAAVGRPAAGLTDCTLKSKFQVSFATEDKRVQASVMSGKGGGGSGGQSPSASLQSAIFSRCWRLICGIDGRGSCYCPNPTTERLAELSVQVRELFDSVLVFYHFYCQHSFGQVSCALGSGVWLMGSSFSCCSI